MAPAIRNYLVVTASYWGFTLVDGALRMLVLLHFFKLGYAPLTLSFLFLLYEFAGIVANLAGGWLATRFGIPRMLAIEQGLQVAGLGSCRRLIRLGRLLPPLPGSLPRRVSPVSPRISPRRRRSRRSRPRRPKARASSSSGWRISRARRTP